MTLSIRPQDSRGRVIPWVAAWSSETWGKSLFEPGLGRNALFTMGRQGRGKPVFGVLNEPRQRDAMLVGICQVCGTRILERDQRFVADPAPGRIQGREGIVVTEPWAHGYCMAYALEHCPALRDTTEVIVPIDFQLIAQIIDPTKAPAKKASRFDPVSAARMETLRSEVKRHNGLVGYIRLHIIEHRSIDRADFMELYPA